MTNLAALRKGMLDACNQVRLAFEAPILTELPRGVPESPTACTGHRALEDLGLGEFFLPGTHIDVDQAFADIIRRAWGTEIAGHNPDICDNDCRLAHVVTPDNVKHFVMAYDRKGYPDLIDLPA